MAHRYKGRAIISATDPRAIALCDRCGFVYNLYMLRPQMKYAGNATINTGLLVCETCMDPLNPQDRPIVPGPDPLPVKNPRPLTPDRESMDD